MEKLKLQYLTDKTFPVFPNVPLGKPAIMIFANMNPFMSGTEAPFIVAGAIKYGKNRHVSLKYEATSEEKARSYIPLLTRELMELPPPL